MKDNIIDEYYNNTNDQDEISLRIKLIWVQIFVYVKSHVRKHLVLFV